MMLEIVPMFDWTINVGNFISLGTVVGALAFYVIDTRNRADSANEKTKLDKEELSRQIDILNNTIKEQSATTQEHLDNLQRQFGDTASALRYKITEVELFVRDHFVRTDALRDMNTALQSQMAEIKSSVNRIEVRVNETRERLP